MSKEATKKFWNMMRNEKKNSAEITIYGTIGSSWWDESVSAKDFAKDLKDLGDDIEEITVHLNSGGGSVFDGLSIRSQLKNHKAYITIIIDGWAASIASIIAMAADKLIMAKGSMMMIHNPLSGGWGEAKDLREIANVLDKIRDSLVSVYASKTGKSSDELIQMMDVETWMSAEEAVEHGFADEVEEDMLVEAKMIGAVAMVNGIEMDFSRFEKAPKLPQQNQTQNEQSIIQKMFNEFKKMFNAENGISNSYQVNTSEEEEDLKSLEEFKNKYPELYNQAIQEGAKIENARIQEIEEYTEPGFEEIMNKAKADPTMTVQVAVMEQMKAMKESRNNQQKNTQNKAQQYLNNLKNDAQDLNDIEGDSAPEGDERDQKEIDNHAKIIAETINRNRGRGVKL